jgi:hypothetical protein
MNELQPAAETTYTRRGSSLRLLGWFLMTGSLGLVSCESLFHL